MRVLQPGGELDLALEPPGARPGCVLRQEDLEGDRTVVAKVAREVDDSHAAAADLALDGVAVGKRLANSLRHSHARLRGGNPGWSSDRK
jgi:hypothetical protein